MTATAPNRTGFAKILAMFITDIVLVRTFLSGILAHFSTTEFTLFFPLVYHLAHNIAGSKKEFTGHPLEIQMKCAIRNIPWSLGLDLKERTIKRNQQSRRRRVVCTLQFSTLCDVVMV